MLSVGDGEGARFAWGEGVGDGDGTVMKEVCVMV